MAGESANDPIHMKIVASEITPGKIIVAFVLTIAPVAIAILMQKPALRQAIAMNVWKRMEIANTSAKGYFEKAAAQCRMKYDLARM